MTQAWILGGTGRSGQAVAAALRDLGHAPVLVGRDAARLETLAAAMQVEARTAAGVEDMADQIRRHRPAVVVNTVGPFAESAPALLDACLQVGSHYVDLANDTGAVAALLERDAEAVSAGSVLVTGAGFGVTATESVVKRMCADRPAPVRVRVDMIPSLATEAGRVGDALAGTMVEGLPDLPGGGRFQGRRYSGGRLAPDRLAGHPLRLTSPDGDRVRTVSMPLGELVAAQRASGAPEVRSASSELPSGPLARATLPLGVRLLAIPGLRSFARRRLADLRFPERPRPRVHSWGHARVIWADGTVEDGWLRLGDAQAFTVAVLTEVTHRLLEGLGRPGAHTPAALFGPGLAEDCGGSYVSDPEGRARWTRRNGASSIGPATYTHPGDDQIVVRVRAIAVNPIDALPVPARYVVLPWLDYPAVLGSDVAGDVVESGSGVRRLKVGDRVVGQAVGVERSRNRPAEGAFQQFVVLSDNLTTPIPDELSFSQAAVLPLALSTAAVGLFQDDQLALALPRAGAADRNEVVVVWGASTSVGSNAVQLARNAGYAVLATASPRNFDYVRSLGAEAAVDYRSATAVEDLVREVAGRPVAGIIAIGAHALGPCLKLAAVTGTGRVASSQPTPLTRLRARLARRHGITLSAIWGGTLKDNDIGKTIYADFLPEALADGRFRAAPEAIVVGEGLEAIPTALKRLGRGVSARKVVVTV